jgi:hypothetical protein
MLAPFSTIDIKLPLYGVRGRLHERRDQWRAGPWAPRARQE